jgi:hypothetical protein
MGIRGNQLNPLILAGLAISAVAGCKGNPSVSFEPPSWDFGSVAYGDQASQTVTVTNTSGYALQVVSIAPADQVRVDGLPIVDLQPGASAPLQVTFRPAFLDRYQQSSSSVTIGFGLLIGGYSGGTWGDESAEVYYDMTGQLADFDGGIGLVCDPGPNGDGAGVIELPSNGELVWSQQGYACASILAPDAGTSCHSASDCPTHCCSCPSDCAGFTAEACLLGTCAPPAVACGLVQAETASSPTLCPDGGNLPSSVLGSLGFTVGRSGEQLSSGTLSVTLARSAPSACNGDTAAPGLSLLLPADAKSLAIYPIGPASATLVDPSLGTLDATGGYVVLTEATGSGVAGGFDLEFSGGSAEIWGTFNAPACP